MARGPAAVALLFAFACTVAAAAVATGSPPLVHRGHGQAPIEIDPVLLTGVTIDVCALKQGLNFSSSALFQTLTSHLAPTVLRIGGTDQNNYQYDMNSTEPCIVCDCGGPCKMTRAYWDSVREFVASTGLKLIFGLSPTSVDNAKQLIEYTAQDTHFAKYDRMLAWSWGNEHIGDQRYVDAVAKNLSVLKRLLLETYNNSGSVSGQRPLLVAPDTGLGPRQGTLPVNISNDSYINGHLQFLELFSRACGDSLDALTWHTYDYRTSQCCQRTTICVQ